MRGYKSSASRLARLFKRSRSAWKEKALERPKRIRALWVRVRDLIQSRDQWKAKAKSLQRELEQLKKERCDAKENDTVETLGETTKSSETVERIVGPEGASISNVHHPARYSTSDTGAQ